MADSVSPVIHQTLHGYADGHTLLAASCDLTPIEKKALLLLSDLSGQTGSRNFDSYLTGYPLPGKRFYAFARTWYAPEMPRPGCVWTQTLLLPLPLLTRIQNLSELNSLFERPVASSVDKYSTAISSEYFIYNRVFDVYQNKSAINSIVYYLYGKAKDTVVIPADNAAIYEKDILGIWTQQWPRLRRSFSFCTGSLSIRQLDDKPLSCQVVPISYGSRLFRQNTNNISIVDIYSKTKPAQWFKFYESIDPRILQTFMYKYGSDIAGKRSKFAPLCFTYSILYDEYNQTISFDDLLSFFKHYFGNINEAKKLKHDLIIKLIYTLPDGEYEFIKTLLTSPDIDVIPPYEWDLSEQIIRLWSEKSIDADRINQLLEGLDISRLSDLQKFNLLKNLPVRLWLEVRWVTDELLKDIINSHPHILEQPDFWNSTIANQQIGIGVLSKNRNTFSSITKIITAMIDADNDRWVDFLSSKFGPIALLTALDILIYRPTAALPRKWEELVWLYPSDFLFWLASTKHYTERTIDLMIQILVSKGFRADNLSNGDLIELLNELIKAKPSSHRNQAMSIWLAKGLNNSHSMAKEITIILFQPIYNIIKRNELDNTSWQILAPVYERTRDISSISDFVNWLLSENKPQPAYWDKCGQLRQKIVESSIYFNWPSKIICQAITDEDTFERTMNYSTQFTSGLQLFGKIYRFIQNSSIYRNSFHYRIIKSEHDKINNSKKKRKR